MPEKEMKKDQIGLLHAEMSELVLKAKVGPVFWAKLLKTKGNLRQRKVLTFLQELKSNQWQWACTAYTPMLASKDYWEMLEIYADEKFPEHVKLLSALKKLKDRVVEFKNELRNVSIED